MRLRMALAAIVALGLLLPANASAGLKAIWGPLTMPDGSSAFDTYDDLGVGVYEMVVQWNTIATARPAHPSDPADPAYQWPDSVDTAIRQARKHHIKVLVLVKGTPPWANGGGAPNVAPTDPGDYASFLTAMSRRYPGVKYWMVWGETNFEGGANFDPMPADSPVGPRRYAILLDRAYAALKHVSRSDVVIGGDTYSAGAVRPRDFVRWMKLPNGKRPRMDWYGHNPYTARFPDLKGKPAEDGYRDISDSDTLAAELRRYFPSHPRLWLSEFSISSDRPTRAFSFFVSRKEQAVWLSAAYKVARQPYVAGLGWFNLLDEPPSVANGLTNGLMTYDGKRKPAYAAYRAARTR
jgi:hypothetical protein